MNRTVLGLMVRTAWKLPTVVMKIFVYDHRICWTPQIELLVWVMFTGTKCLGECEYFLQLHLFGPQDTDQLHEHNMIPYYSLVRTVTSLTFLSLTRFIIDISSTNIINFQHVKYRQIIHFCWCWAVYHDCVLPWPNWRSIRKVTILVLPPKCLLAMLAMLVLSPVWPVPLPVLSCEEGPSVDISPLGLVLRSDTIILIMITALFKKWVRKGKLEDSFQRNIIQLSVFC